MRSAVQSCDPLQENDTAEKSAVFFVACRDEVHPYRAGDHESWLSMGYRQIRQMPPGMAGDKSDSTIDSNHGVFLGNKRLRSKSGLEGGTEWRLKHPATRYKKTTLQIPLRCFFVCPDFSPSRPKSVGHESSPKFWLDSITISILNPDKCVIFDFATYTYCCASVQQINLLYSRLQRIFAER